MAESFLQNAQLTGLDRQARRTEILRAKGEAALEARIAALEAGVAAQTDRMACLVNHNVAQNVANATVVALAMNSETFDTHGMHDTSTNNSRITIPTGGAGLWHVGYSCSWDPNTSGTSRDAWIRKNGAASPYLGYTKLPGNYNYQSHAGSHVIRLADSDYLELCVVQDSGSTRQIRGTNSVGQLLAFWAYRLGD